MLTNQKLCFKICWLGSCWRSWRNNSWFLWGCFQSRWPIYRWAWISRSISSVEQCCLWGRSVWLYSFGIQWKYHVKLGIQSSFTRADYRPKSTASLPASSGSVAQFNQYLEGTGSDPVEACLFFRQTPFLQSTCENHYLLYYLFFFINLQCEERWEPGVTVGGHFGPVQVSR